MLFVQIMISVACCAICFYVGYKIGRKRLESHNEEQIRKIQKRFY